MLRSLNYYVGPFAASKNNQQGQKGHEQGVGVESLTMGQTIIRISHGTTPLKKVPSLLRPLCWWERDQCLAHCQGLHPNTLSMALLTLLVNLAGCKRDHIIVQGP